MRNAEFVQKKSLLNYRGDAAVLFIKITLADQRSLPKIRDKFPRCIVSLAPRTYLVVITPFRERRSTFQRGILY